MNDFARASASLREVLLGYLQTEGAFPWPGADGLTVDEVLAARLWRVPGLAELRRRHPDLADEAAAFFAASTPGVHSSLPQPSPP
jgi:hypothetical protein